jgi:hypothetical protein
MKKTIIAILLAVAMFFAGRGCGKWDGRTVARSTTRIDTVWVRDTIRDTVPVPKNRLIVRIDTVWLHPVRDTAWPQPLRDTFDSVPENPPSAFRLPIEQKIYETADYRAVVEGFRPALVGMEIYRNSAVVTKETIRAPPPARWGIGIHAGYGITPKGPAPYLGVGLQYNIIVW